MRLAVWPVPPAQALADVLAEAGPVTEVSMVAPYDAVAALREDRADLALVPTLDVLRDPEAFELLPGVALVGEQDPLLRLVLGSPLDQIRRIAFDPRYGQAALLAQIVLKEHYGARPSFSPVDPAIPLDATLADRDAAFVPLGTETGTHVALDLGQEWTELTLRPMVWGLVAARAGALDADDARALAEAAAVPPEETEALRHYQLTLDGYGHAGLDELVSHLYYHRVLDDLPALPFVATPQEDEPHDS